MSDDKTDPRDDLETALVHLKGVADVLYAVGKTENSVAYLAGRLNEHHEEADDAFCRIFKLHEYGEAQSSTPIVTPSPWPANRKTRTPKSWRCFTNGSMSAALRTRTATTKETTTKKPAGRRLAIIKPTSRIAYSRAAAVRSADAATVKPVERSATSYARRGNGGLPFSLLAGNFCSCASQVVDQ